MAPPKEATAMSADPSIRCRCGAEILPGHVLQKGFVTIGHIPVFVYLQYRCGVCRTRNAILLACDETGAIGASRGEREAGTYAVESRQAENERAYLAARYGRIRPEEVEAFTWALGRLTSEDFARLRRSLTP